MIELDPENPECPKCGALLASAEEVLCENCGTAFGVKTTVMTAVSPTMAKKKGQSGAKIATARKKKDQAASKPPMLALAIVGIIALACLVVLVILIAT